MPLLSSIICNTTSNKQILNNTKCITDVIKLYNEFLDDNTNQTEEINFFQLRNNDLINTKQILDIIRSNAKPWLSYNGLSFINPQKTMSDTLSKNKVHPQAFIMFDLLRIENEIKNKCISTRSKLILSIAHFEFIGSKNMLMLIQALNINQSILPFDTWRLFDQQFESNTQRKQALVIVEEIIALIINSTANKTVNNMININKDLSDIDDDKQDEKDDYKSNIINLKNVYDNNEELSHFAKHKLKLADDRCEIFVLQRSIFGSNSKKTRKIRLKHIQSLWHELIKRIDGEMIQYKDKCLICFDKLLSITETPITLDCCSLSIHYKCLQDYVKYGFGNNGTRITLQQLSCPLCRQPMKHTAARKLFQDTQFLYNKVKEIALDQLKKDGKLNDRTIINSNGEYFNNPQGYAMKLYAFFLCFKCKEPYFYGANECGNAEEKYNDYIESRLCEKCKEERLKELDKAFDIWKNEQNVKKCPLCKGDTEKKGGCPHMTCICGAHWCWICGEQFTKNTIYPHIGKKHRGQ